ncbi:MAG: hypothetical protein WC455_24025 [Dehalococcoidia bacterium]|jgi:hypothetical protein
MIFSDENENDAVAYWDALWEQSYQDLLAFYCKDKRRRDEGNFQSMLKATYDGLVDSGLCDDDDSLHMHKCPPRFMVDKQHPRVELLIERVR